mgnify:CR=1 FL=1
MRFRVPYQFFLILGWMLLICEPFVVQAQDTLVLYGDTIRVGELEWDMQKDWRSKRKLITENRELYGDHVRILLTYHKNRMVSEINFGYVDKAEGFVKHGPARYYYDSGHLKSKRQFEEGKMNGRVEDFFKSGKTQVISHVHNDSLQGSYTTFYPEGIPEQKGHYEGNALNGRYQAWYNTGETKWIEHWDKGVKTGIDSAFYETGKLESAIPFTDGEEDGIARGYHRNGKQWTEWVFEKGRLLEIRFVQNSNGNPLEIGSFRKGSGWVNIYKSNGLVREKRLYRDGYLRRVKPVKE